jgi:hypothetical protein
MSQNREDVHPQGVAENYPLYVYLPTDSGRCKCNRSDFAMKYR